MKPLRIIGLAASLMLIALCGIAGQIAPDGHRATAKATPAAVWPWSPKGGDPGPFELPAQVISVPAKAPLARWSYGWPLKPFDRPHPVRGYLDDPRISSDLTLRTFHFGIDISAAPGTPVFAIEAGTARRPLRSTVYVRSGVRTFEYWHIVPVVRTGQRVGRHTLPRSNPCRTSTTSTSPSSCPAATSTLCAPAASDRSPTPPSRSSPS